MPSVSRPADKRIRLGALLSGGGRTVLNLADEIDAGRLPASIEIVISSRIDAAGVERCRDRGLQVEVVSRRELPDPEFHDRISTLLVENDVDLVCMAGFLTLWRIPEAFQGKVINIHPALLPDFGGQGFYGNRVHAAVLKDNCIRSGCSVHFADNEYDHGPVIAQAGVPVTQGDDVHALAARVFEAECKLYPAVIADFARHRLLA